MTVGWIAIEVDWLAAVLSGFAAPVLAFSYAHWRVSREARLRREWIAAEADRLRDEFEALLAAGVSREQANEILIQKIEGKAVTS